MKRYLRGALWLSLALLLVTSLPWSGTAVANNGHTDSNSGIKTSNPSCAYNISGLEIGTAPSQFSNPDQLINNTHFNGSNYVANQDWLALRLPESSTQQCSNRDPVGSNIAYATPATPNTNTTHTIAPKIDETIANISQVSVKYEIRPELNSGIYRSNVLLFGVDVDRDGFIETSLKSSIKYVTSPDLSTIQFSLNGNVTIPAESYLIIRYNGVTNPAYADRHRIETVISGNKTSIDTGHIEYDEDLTGLLSKTTSISVMSITGNSSQLVTLRPSTAVSTNGSLYIFLPTEANLSHPQLYSITVTDTLGQKKGESIETNQITKNIPVYKRNAYIFSSPKIQNKTISIKGYTNIAPNSSIDVWVFNRGRLIDGGTRIGDSPYWSVEIKLPDELLNSETIQVKVLDQSGNTLAKESFFLFGTAQLNPKTASG